MAVGVERDGDGGMAESLGDDLGVRTGREGDSPRMMRPRSS